MKFPVVDVPENVYGAAHSKNAGGSYLREVGRLLMGRIVTKFGEDAIDIIHFDIQGAESYLIRRSRFVEAIRKKQFVLFGTHLSVALHNEVKDFIDSSCM